MRTYRYYERGGSALQFQINTPLPPFLAPCHVVQYMNNIVLSLITLVPEQEAPLYRPGIARVIAMRL
jgi:hypothetical protein